MRHSPEYLERFQLMTRGEQIRTLSRLTVTVLATYGSAAATTRTVATVGSGLESRSLPALSLAADGALVLERVAWFARSARKMVEQAKRLVATRSASPTRACSGCPVRGRMTGMPRMRSGY
ncbi:hypothetical protein [Archangium sp.]|uniref:hypothetical protein n=1 Tax=Archangium sp. TaxID=1872627 RepID=UPI002D4B4C27|nr:hypothetical protein [Archangium sp.]HYO52918.1 hypothetical protein [Archangium sp.]